MKKDKDGEQEGDILVERAIMGLARILALQKVPGIHKDDPTKTLSHEFLFLFSKESPQGCSSEAAAHPPQLTQQGADFPCVAALATQIFSFSFTSFPQAHEPCKHVNYFTAWLL